MRNHFKPKNCPNTSVWWAEHLHRPFGWMPSTLGCCGTNGGQSRLPGYVCSLSEIKVENLRSGQWWNDGRFQPAKRRNHHGELGCESIFPDNQMHNPLGFFSETHVLPADIKVSNSLLDNTQLGVIVKVFLEEDIQFGVKISHVSAADVYLVVEVHVVLLDKTIQIFLHIWVVEVHLKTRIIFFCSATENSLSWTQPQSFASRLPTLLGSD